MKKKLVALLIGVCSVMLVACGADDANVAGVEALPMEQTASVEKTETASSAETVESSEKPAESSDTAASSESVAADDQQDADDETTISWLGEWHEKELGMDLTVTENGNGYKYVINWPDTQNSMTFVWEINGNLNEAGVVYYKNGVASVIEKDEDGNDTTSILSENAQGSFALLYDGTLLWTEEVETEVEHSFTR